MPYWTPCDGRYDSILIPKRDYERRFLASCVIATLKLRFWAAAARKKRFIILEENSFVLFFFVINFLSESEIFLMKITRACDCETNNLMVLKAQNSQCNRIKVSYSSMSARLINKSRSMKWPTVGVGALFLLSARFVWFAFVNEILPITISGRTFFFLHSL